jgi:hypothetical protein
MGTQAYLACHRNKIVLELGRGGIALGELLAYPKTRPTDADGVLKVLEPFFHEDDGALSSNYAEKAAAVVWEFLRDGGSKFEMGADSGDAPNCWYEHGYMPVGSLYFLDDIVAYQQNLQVMIKRAIKDRDESMISSSAWHNPY